MELGQFHGAGGFATPSSPLLEPPLVASPPCADATAVPEFPWWYTPSSEQPAPDGSSPPTQGQVGLCNEILTAVCTRGDLDCEAVLMPFQDMVASVQNGTIDFAVDILSLTGERVRTVLRP